MRLNPDKYAFRVQAGKFLGFMLTSRGIEANPDKCEAILAMRSPTSIKEVQQLTCRIKLYPTSSPKSPDQENPFF